LNGCTMGIAAKKEPLGEKLAFHAVRLRKTYGVKKIPRRLFSDCRLAEKPKGDEWREHCGCEPVCRSECPRCWTLNLDELKIPQGKATAILGHSGSGKTTLLNLLALLDRPDSDSGGLSLNFTWPEADQARRADCLGKTPLVSPLLNLSYSRMRRDLFGFVFQSGHLNSNLNAFWNLALAQGLSGAPLKEMKRRAEGLFDGIGFPARRRRALPRHLSGGEYQRIAVARALAHNPQVVFADEPTGNLDPVNGQRVIDLLLKWRESKESNTLILVTHNPDQAIDHCDHILVLNAGRITLSSPRAEIDLDTLNRALRKGALIEC
jgi:putative ABC transport system ATP-binding protein